MTCLRPALLLTAVLVCGCSNASSPNATSTAPATNAAATYTATATATVLAPASDPVIKTYARGDTVDVPRGTLFLDPKTGGGEAWADVSVSPLGTFAKWNGPDGKEPPVLYDTLTRRRIELDTGGQSGQVLNFSPDETEVAVRVGGEVRIASTQDGSVRVRFNLPADAFSIHADWGPAGAVAVTSSAKDQNSLGVIVSSGSSMQAFPNVPDNWTEWSPDGGRLLVSGIEGPDGWLAIVDVASGAVTRVEQALLNPNWSAGGRYFEGQLVSGELLVFGADGTPVMRMNGVCALVSSPWLGDEIITLGSDSAVAMDGSVRSYKRPANTQNITTFAPDNGVVLLGPGGTTTLAQLKVADSIPVSGYLGFPWVTPDGRGKLQLGVGGKGACENVGAFKVEMLNP